MASPTIVIGGRKFRLAVEHYSDNNRPALCLVNSRGIYAIVTVNIPSAIISEGEFLMKFWSENEPLAAPLVASGLFEDTGKVWATGFVQAPVWKLSEEGRKHVRLS